MQNASAHSCIVNPEAARQGATELRTVIASAIPRSIRLEKSMHALVENRATVKILPETIEKRITAVDNAMTAT